MDTKKVKSVLKKIDNSKKIVAAERDKLRELYNELEELLESFDEGVESIENGKREIENGIDSLSKYV
jgi:septation ring formation regulator EzrA